jgi:hypothetical protein
MTRRKQKTKQNIKEQRIRIIKGAPVYSVPISARQRFSPSSVSSFTLVHPLWVKIRFHMSFSFFQLFLHFRRNGNRTEPAKFWNSSLKVGHDSMHTQETSSSVKVAFYFCWWWFVLHLYIITPAYAGRPVHYIATFSLYLFIYLFFTEESWCYISWNSVCI